MTYGEMRPGVHYVVESDTTCGTLDAGDHVHLTSEGSLMCIEAGGWIPARAAQKLDFHVRLDTEYLRTRIRDFFPANVSEEEMRTIEEIFIRVCERKE